MSQKTEPEPGGDPVEVKIIRDGRLRTRIHWEWNGNQVTIRAPRRTPQRELDKYIAEIVEEVTQRRAKTRARADGDLEAIARHVNQRYFDGELSWHTIRWVVNMRTRIGSCTNGGPTDGDIRISDQAKNWPRWVIEYIVAHEIAHRKYANHSKAFWDYVRRYPRAERAQGFILGVAFQHGEDADEWL